MAVKRTTKSAKKPAATAEAGAPTGPKVTTQAIDINEAIRARAYKIFEERGYEHGHDYEDWLRAEEEVLARFGARTA